MTILDAQRDVRRVFRNGSVGGYVSAALWFASAACATWAGPAPAIGVLVAGGILIFPVTRLVLALLGGPSGLPAGHPMNALGTQVALALPLGLPVAGGAALYRLDWFYPAFMVLVGAHYLPFAFLYGRRAFVVLSGVLVAGGLWLGLYGPRVFAAGGWITGGALLAFALASSRSPARGEA